LISKKLLIEGLPLYLRVSLCSQFQKLVLVLFILCSCNLQAGPKPVVPEKISGANNLTAEQVIELILSTPDLLIIDSRKKTEYIKGHIEGAVNIINTKMTKVKLAGLAKNKESRILFYCNGDRCMRSGDAVKKSLLWGYKNIFWFRGGWKEWTDKRLPVIIE
jgi:rhodanese-related sulfurtransferase